MTYRETVLRTAAMDQEEKRETRLCRAALGLAGEAGEVVDLIKKHVFHEKPLDTDTLYKLIKELGDVRWYLEYFTLVLGTSMEYVEEVNTKKLQERYPNGFPFKNRLEEKE